MDFRQRASETGVSIATLRRWARRGPEYAEKAYAKWLARSSKAGRWPERYVDMDGETIALVDLARLLGIAYTTLKSRLDRYGADSQRLLAPVKRKK